jgi:hypothetical protein
MMKNFKLTLGRLCVLTNETATSQGTLDRTEEHYGYIGWSKVDTDGDVMEIGLEPCWAKALVELLKDDPLFALEAHIEVWKYQEEKLYDFDGTLFDALLVIANEGAQYDV